MKKLFYLLLIPILWSCKKDDPAPVIVTFAQASSEGVEGTGTQSIVIEFDRTTEQSVQLIFSVTGDAALNGDYSPITTSPMTVSGGASSASIDFDIIDESIIETADKMLTFRLVSATNGTLNTTAGTLTHTFTLKDNDVVPTNGLQFDLTWDLGTDVDIDLVDFDLFQIYNIVESGGSITDFDLYMASTGENLTGFETVFLANTAPDDDYYTLVIYASGDSSGDFVVSLNSLSFSGEAIGSFTSSDTGSGIVIGPVTKSGSDFSARTSNQELETIKVSAKTVEAVLNK